MKVFKNNELHLKLFELRDFNRLDNAAEAKIASIKTDDYYDLEFREYSVTARCALPSFVNVLPISF